MTERTRPEVTESLPGARADSARVKVHEWTLEVAAGPDMGQKVKTLESLVRVGTDSTNDLVLTDPTVSRRHLELERTPKGFVVRDLGSRNGVFLEGHQVLQAVAAPGDRITLGKTRLALKQESKATEVEVTAGDRFGALFGRSEQMRAVFAVLRNAAREDLSVLLEGETGTGKELAARALHQHSARRHGPFKVVDCNLLTEEVAERELPDVSGGLPPLLEAARGGTLFLDEVGELPLPVQRRLLRLLERRELDLRVVASTHRNLEDEVRNDRFRGDLYFRLAVAKVRLPPLRTRREELPALCAHLTAHLGAGAQLDLSPQTLSLFENYDWPGNVRELRNVLERGALLQETGNAQWLDFMAAPRTGARPKQSVSDVLTRMRYHEAKDRVVGDFERIYFAEVMRRSGFDMKVAEDQTGLSLQSLYRLLKKNGLKLKDLKNAEGLDR